MNTNFYFWSSQPHKRCWWRPSGTQRICDIFTCMGPSTGSDQVLSFSFVLEFNIILLISKPFIRIFHTFVGFMMPRETRNFCINFNVSAHVLCFWDFYFFLFLLATSTLPEVIYAVIPKRDSPTLATLELEQQSEPHITCILVPHGYCLVVMHAIDSSNKRMCYSRPLSSLSPLKDISPSLSAGVK